MTQKTITHLLAFIREHGFECGYGNGRIAIGIPYSQKHVFTTGSYSFTNDVRTVLVRPNAYAVRQALGY